MRPEAQAHEELPVRGILASKSSIALVCIMMITHLWKPCCDRLPHFSFWIVERVSESRAAIVTGQWRS